MAPARFFAPRRGAGHEGTHQEHVLGLPPLRVVKDLVERVPAPEVEHVHRIPELGARPLDPRIPPHRRPQTAPHITQVKLALLGKTDVAIERCAISGHTSL